MRGSFSPPPPSSASSAFAARVPRSVVTSLAIHGHAKPGEDGVRIKMYLKIALTAEHTTMGLVPLFPEENSIRILQYAVHPLDSAGAPYAGGPKANRLLKRASRALQLPSETTKSYLDALLISPGPGYSSRRPGSIYQAATSPSSASPPPPLDVIHTGSIQVSNYAVCFVLPKLWPRVGAESESDDFMSRTTPLSVNRARRSSVGGDKKAFRFMAAIEVVVPFLSTPPRSPYLLSIPLPKCLSNKLQLKIFGPPQSDALVHEDDVPRWDVTTDPVVQHRNSSLQLPASSRYGHVADDEDFSDASETNMQTETGLVLIQGAFPSTDRLRIRWAQALYDAETIPLDNWRRASCSRVNANLKITVLEALREPDSPAQCDALRLGIEYSADCLGVVHPGVATRLAMDVMLDTKQQTVTWAYPSEASPDGTAAAIWNVTSKRGLLGFDVGGNSPTTPLVLSRRTSASSFDSVPGSPASFEDRSNRMRKSSIPVPSALASLLNVPLPLEAVSDYSFEAQPHRTPSLSSVPSSATGLSQLTSANEQDAIAMSLSSPAHRISLHIDMDEILPKSRAGSNFSYTINGVVDVRMNTQPAFSSESSQTDDDPMGRVEGFVELPIFHMFGVPEADEHIQVSVVSNITGVMLSSGPAASSASSSKGATKRQLRLGILLGCTKDAQLSYKQYVVPTTPVAVRKESTFSSMDSPRPTNGVMPTDSMQLRMPKLPFGRTPLRREDSDPLSALDTGRSSASPSAVAAFDIIPWVHVYIEPMPAPATQMRAHAVRVRMPAAGIDTSRLEFALKTRTVVEEKDNPLEVSVIYASVGGRPVETKVLHGRTPEPGAVALSDGADATWITVFLGSTTGAVADVELLYTVAQPGYTKSQTDDLLAVVPPDGAVCVSVLPWFYLPVGYMRVEIQEPPGYRIKSLDSNMKSAGGPTSPIMTRYSLPCKFSPHLSFCLVEEASIPGRRSWMKFLLVLSWLITAFSLYLAYMESAHIRDLRAVMLGTGFARAPRYVDDGASFTSQSVTSPGYIHMPTFEVPPNRGRQRSVHEGGNAPLETGLSVVERVRHSLTLRPDDLRNLLAAFSTTAAAEALNRLLTSAMKLLRRLMHYPLPVDD